MDMRKDNSVRVRSLIKWSTTPNKVQHGEKKKKGFTAGIAVLSELLAHLSGLQEALQKSPTLFTLILTTSTWQHADLFITPNVQLLP